MDSDICRSLGLGPMRTAPLPGRFYPDEYQAQARQRSDRIFADWKLLQEILDRHEEIVFKRWTKKTKIQRHEILLAAWPNMAASHRPDFRVIEIEDEEILKSGNSRFRDCFLWPYVNLEDLGKPRNLPFFLRSRARNAPGVFAMVDTDSARLGYITGAIQGPKGILHFDETMMFSNRNDPSTYGELVPWDENDQAEDWMKSGRGVMVGEGMIILEIQERIYRFLVECCQRVLHDIPAGDITSDRYSVQPPMKLETGLSDSFTSLTATTIEAPYHAPHTMNWQRIESLFEAKKSAAEDHIWALREDPGYFRDALLEYKEHRREIIKDTKGKDHPALGNDGYDLWRRVLNEVITGAHSALERWNELLRQVRNLRELQTKHESKISIDKELPQEFLDAVLDVYGFLQFCTTDPKRQLCLCVPPSPPLRYLYVRHPQDPTHTKITVEQKTSIKLGNTKTEMLWLLQTLWEDGTNLFYSGFTNIMDELERLQQSQPEAKAMVSAHVADVISNLSVLNEAIRDLERFQPWARTFANLLKERVPKMLKSWEEWEKGCDLHQAALVGTNIARLVQLGRPDAKKFSYPVEKRRTKENVEMMRAAENNLDKFWKALDANFRGRSKNHPALMHLLSRSKILQRTPEWTEPDRSAKLRPQAEVDTVMKPLSELYFELEVRTERTIARTSTYASASTKVKTKGVTTFNTLATEDLVAVRDQSEDDPTVPLDTRALKVFRILFYTPSISGTPGELAWTDFLHAMVATGFVPEKLYGSVWQFSPTQLDVKRSIQFHEPHPSGKLPYTTARRFGRRLNRAYGWESRRFVPKIS